MLRPNDFKYFWHKCKSERAVLKHTMITSWNCFDIFSMLALFPWSAAQKNNSSWDTWPEDFACHANFYACMCNLALCTCNIFFAYENGQPCVCKHLLLHPKKNKSILIFWKREEGDVHCLWQYGQENIQSFLDYLNGCHPRIR